MGLIQRFAEGYSRNERLLIVSSVIFVFVVLKSTFQVLANTFAAWVEGRVGLGEKLENAVARQFATNKKCLVIRNGWFSFRWSQIFDMGDIPSESMVLKARPVEQGRQAAYAPAPIEEVVAAIRENKPDLVFAPHVETASGMMLPDAWLRAVSDAVHAVGGMFVLDCIASGTIWVDMQANGVDVLISAPQKGWSASPCCARRELSAQRIPGSRGRAASARGRAR